MKAGYRPDIDGLRAVAVISVILVHLGIEGFSGGFVGVDVFFVISGFLISRLIWQELKAGTFHFLNFYERRSRRIIPSLLATLLLSFIGAGLLFSPSDLVAYGTSLMAALLFVSNFHFWQEIGYFTSEIDIKPLIHTWSLSVEEQFYMLWPLLMVGLVRFRRTWMAYLVVALLAAASLAAAQMVVTMDANAAFYLLPFRIFEFCVGAALVWLQNALPKRKWLLEPLPIIGLAMIGYAVTTYTNQTPFPSVYALIPCIGAALIIYAGGVTRSRWILANPLMVGIGLISYQLYLVHWPLIVYFTYASLTALDMTQKLIIVGVTTGISILMYYLIDRPLRRVKTRDSLMNFAIGCAAVIAVLSILIMTLHRDRGWQWRINEEFRTLITSPNKFHETQYGGAGLPGDTVIKLGDQNAIPSFIIFGDSFAAQYAFGVTHLLEPMHRSAYGLFDHGCVVGPGVTTFTLNVLDKVCAGEFEKIVKLMEGNTLPIVIAHSWNTYREQLGDAEGNPLHFANDDEYYGLLLRTVEAIRQAAGDQRKIVIIGLTPGIRDQRTLARCFMVPTYIDNGCASHVTLKQEDVADGMAFNAKLKAYGAQYPNVTIIDPYEAFCSNGECIAIESAKLFYSDRVHLSMDGSKRFIEHFRDIFSALLPGPVSAEPAVPSAPDQPAAQ